MKYLRAIDLKTMDKKKRIISISIAAVTILLMFVLIFAGCGRKDPNVSLITDQVSEWAFKTEKGTSVYFYGLTDMDQNGRPEIIAVENYGVANITQSSFYEISEDGKSLNKLEHVFENDSQTDLMVKDVVCYMDKETDTYYYIFTDEYKESTKEIYTTKVALSLKNGVVTEERLATEKAVYSTESTKPVLSYTDSIGKTITAEEYANAEAVRFEGYKEMSAVFHWKGFTHLNHDKTINTSNKALYDILEDSSDNFKVK